MDYLKLTPDKLSVEEINNMVMDDSCGAVSLFVGTTRDNFEGKKVLCLEYEAYEAMALKALKSICEETRTKWPAVYNIAIYHRLGEVPTREASVVIAVSSPHRRDSLDAVAHCIDQVKASVPIWKKEVYEGEAPVWKENKESVKSTVDAVCAESEIDSSLVQINVSSEEILERINNFIKRKREQVDRNNIHDFIPASAREDGEDSCARIRTTFVRRNDSKGHLKVRRVYNEWGPQTAGAGAGAGEAEALPAAVAERARAVERFLRLAPVPGDVYRRLKALEDRMADLQAMSPEYAQFWRYSASGHDEKETEIAFNAEDISKKIELLEKSSLKE